ncbi:MAG: hypothetical protein HZB37_01105 [Planctomycetes bacterium]|nr:hypothetical protein [Planctomycetota bacterium]
MDASENKQVNRGMRYLWIVWAGLLYALYAYFKLCRILENQAPYFSNVKLPIDAIKYGLFIVTGVLLFFAYSLRNAVQKNQYKSLSPKIIARAAKVNKPAIFVKYSTTVIYSQILSLSIGLLGLFFFLVSGDWQPFYILIVISALAIIYLHPKRKEFERISN